MTALSVTFEGWHPRNVARVRRALDTSLRNEEIRAAYHNRGDADPGETIDALAREHSLSPDTVQRIIYPR